jgi:hypothetical protein
VPARSLQSSRRSLKIALTIAALLAAFLATTASVAPAQTSTDSDRITGWRSDIAYYIDQMRRQHYVYRSKPLPSAMLIAAQQLSANVPRYSDERMLAEFEHLASFAGDGHTYMLPFGAKRVVAHMLPLRLYQFSDGLYVVDALNDSSAKWIGARVLKIGKKSAEDVIDAERPTLSVDNRLGYLWVGPPLLSFAGYLEKFAGVTPGASIPLTVRTRAGQVVSVNVPLVAAPPMRGIPKLPASKVSGASSAPLYLKNRAELLVHPARGRQRSLRAVQPGAGRTRRNPCRIRRPPRRHTHRTTPANGDHRRAAQQRRQSWPAHAVGDSGPQLRIEPP